VGASKTGTDEVMGCRGTASEKFACAHELNSKTVNQIGLKADVV